MEEIDLTDFGSPPPRYSSQEIAKIHSSEDGYQEVPIDLNETSPQEVSVEVNQTQKIEFLGACGNVAWIGLSIYIFMVVTDPMPCFGDCHDQVIWLLSCQLFFLAIYNFMLQRWLFMKTLDWHSVAALTIVLLTLLIFGGFRGAIFAEHCISDAKYAILFHGIVLPTIAALIVAILYLRDVQHQ